VDKPVNIIVKIKNKIVNEKVKPKSCNLNTIGTNLLKFYFNILFMF